MSWSLRQTGGGSNPPSAVPPKPAAAAPRARTDQTDQTDHNADRKQRRKPNEAGQTKPAPQTNTQAQAQAQKRDIFNAAAAKLSPPLAAGRASSAKAVQALKGPPAQPQTAVASQKGSADCMVSVYKGKIGSIYFGSMRVRANHPDGPGAEKYNLKDLSRFQINDEQALLAFHKDLPPDFHKKTKERLLELPMEQRAKAYQKLEFKACSKWMAAQLKESVQNGTPSPPWSTQVSNSNVAQTLTPFVSPAEELPHEDPTVARMPREDAAPTMSTGSRLFELFHDKEPPRDYHISRGIPMQLSVPKETIAILLKAVMQATAGTDIASEAKVSSRRPEVLRRTPEEKNTIFQEYVEARAPEFARLLARSSPAP